MVSQWPKLYQEEEQRLCGRNQIYNLYNKIYNQDSNKIYLYSRVVNL